MNDRDDRVNRLHRQRPKSIWLRWNTLGLVSLFVVSWLSLDVNWSGLISHRRLDNLSRFFGQLYPFELRDRPFSAISLVEWGISIWDERGAEATAATFSISVLAIILASLLALVCIFPASRNISSPEPFLPAGSRPTMFNKIAWSAMVWIMRGIFIVARAIPEYIWAFLLIALIGPSAWPAIFALAIHNVGILGKLGAEIVENTDPAAPRALRGQGLSRTQIASLALIPASLPKWLLFFFYRWESCIREATVIGMLGISSLGMWITDARVRDWYDEMLFFILLGAGLVLLGDLVSALTRRYLRRA
ncbi:MAG: ABC transporter permease subunit [Planctomycetales bacterium]